MREQFEKLIALIESRCDYSQMKETITKCIEELLLAVDKQKDYEIDEEINELTFSRIFDSSKVQQRKILADVKDKEKKAVMWKQRPKYWERYNGNVDWDENVIKDRNKSKGCLQNCGKTNNSDMVQCDGCGKWSHFTCEGLDEVLTIEEDFICISCQTRVKNRKEEIL